MSNNIYDNDVSKKVIWEGSITPDNDTPPLESQMQIQPQMMFCYKCNNVIPCNSNYCPYCQVKLFTECPNCGAKYSSQYPACNQCGTNKEKYLKAQRKDRERKEAIEREYKRQIEIAERKRLEKEHKRKETEEERERQEKETYLKENAEIMKSKEYKKTYSLLHKAFEDYEKRMNRTTFFNMGCILIPLFTIIIMYTLFEIHPILGFILIMVLPFWYDHIKENKNKCQNQLQKYISNNTNHNNHMVTPDLINTVSYQGKERLSDCCIIAYRKKHGLRINYKWHSLR